MSESTVLILILIVGCIICLLFLMIGIRLGLFMGGRRAKKDLNARIETERSDAIKRSRAVLTGQFSEQLAPFLPEFPGDPTECRFIGKPVDFVSFSGAAQGRIDEVLFIEVKSGDSRLTPVEQTLKSAVEKGCVRYVEYRVP